MASKMHAQAKVPEVVTDWLKVAFKKFSQPPPKVAKLPKLKRNALPHLYVLSIFDHHFGKYAWAPETGNNYDLRTAEQCYRKAFAELLERVASFNIDLFVIPIGNDLIHYDSIKGRTANDTTLDSVDSRLHKIWGICSQMFVDLISPLTERAKVQLVYVPGNHDYHSSQVVYHYLAQYFRNNRRVITSSFEETANFKQYIHYGCNLLGFTHGDTIKQPVNKLPIIMAEDNREIWPQVTDKEWLLGHVHHKTKNQVLEIDSTILRHLPSLSGADLWHVKNGYISKRAAEAYLYSKSRGYVGHFSASP